MRPEHIHDLVWVSEPALSPDGVSVVYVVNRVDKAVNQYRSRIFVTATDGSATPRALTDGKWNEVSPRWAPDGNSLAYVLARRSDHPDGPGAEIRMLSVAGPGESALVTASPEAISDVRFSPDGRRIAFVTRVRDSHYAVDDMAARRPRRVTRPFYRLNGQGVTLDRPSHVHVAELDGSGVVRDLTPGDAHYASPAWTADGDSIVASCEDPARLWLANDIDIIDVETTEVRHITNGTGRYQGPLVDDDGTIAVLGFDDTDTYPQNNRVGIIAPTASRATWLEHELDRTWDSIGDSSGTAGSGWSHSDGIWGIAQNRGNVHLYSVVPGAEPQLAVGGQRQVTGWSRRANTVAFTATTPIRPAELYVSIDGEERRITHVAGSLVSQVQPRDMSHFTAPSEDGTEIDAWVVTPHNFDPDRRYPMLLNIHGGPFSQYGSMFFDEAQHQAAAGFVVVMANPHGSSGRDTAWGQATMGRKHRQTGTGWGEIDYRDLMSVVDTAVDRFAYIDAARLGVIGGSYGGYMTSWIISHTNRFKAACSERAVNNLASLDQASDSAGLWRSWFGPSQREDLAEYMAMSPITYADAIKTPLLILHSDQDLRCPTEQADQLFAALVEDGKDVEYYLFPGENHELSRSGSPAHRVQRAELIIEFFTRHLVSND
jgi:dipeptidyl aminopeptidase/acylaminoacyl peptidase